LGILALGVPVYAFWARRKKRLESRQA
jgi:hypothetical protein